MAHGTLHTAYGSRHTARSTCQAAHVTWHITHDTHQHFYPIKITTTWNALPNEVVTSITVNSFKNSLDKHWAENPPSMPCTIQVCTNSHRPAFCWKWTQWSVLRLLLLLLLLSRPQTMRITWHTQMPRSTRHISHGKRNTKHSTQNTVNRISHKTQIKWWQLKSGKYYIYYSFYNTIIIYIM